MTTMTTPTPTTRQPGAPWSISAAAAFLGISAKTLIRAIDDGRVVAIRIGRRVLIADTEVQRIAHDGC